MCFVTSIFAHILRLIIQNRLHLLLKVLLHQNSLQKALIDSPDLEISKAFLIGLEVSFSRVFCFCFFLFLHLVVSNFFADRSGSLGFVVLSFGFQESDFSEFKDTTYRTERIN